MKNIRMNVEMTKAILDGRKVQTRRVVKLPDCKWSNGRKTKVSIDSIWLEDSPFCEAPVKKITITGVGDDEDYSEEDFIKSFAKYQIGETIWVREPAKITRCDAILNQFDYQYLADGTNKWQEDIPNRFIVDDTDNVSLMYPKWIYSQQGIPNGCIKEMARIFLKITNVRAERLQDISGLDCLAEGLVEVSKDGFLHKYCLYDKKDYSSTPWQDMPKVPQEVYKALWNKTAPKGYRWDDNPYVFAYEFEKVEG